MIQRGQTMMRTTYFLAAVMLASMGSVHAGKDDLKRSIEAMADESWVMAKSIWDFAEPGYLESRSSALIADRLENGESELLSSPSDGV
ncbi:MAG: hypothetical protein EBU51_07070 [Synechococcaceae bacterium WB6_3A_227]|nr:hypothetical protein [Synechococcaceae bacterium WB6_3A_227]